MSIPVFLLACLGGGIGACLRFVGDGLVMQRAKPGFPAGIFLVNALGSFPARSGRRVVQAGLVDLARLFISGGVLGGFTAFQHGDGRHRSAHAPGGLVPCRQRGGHARGGRAAGAARPDPRRGL